MLNKNDTHRVGITNEIAPSNDASKKLDGEIKRGIEIQKACPYKNMCKDPPNRCAEYAPGCQSEWKHFANNDD
jgi:hypothetical protein